jgi:hypothetical protein
VGLTAWKFAQTKSGCTESNRVTPGPRPGGAPLPLHPVNLATSGAGEIRTLIDLLAGQVCSQLPPQPQFERGALQHCRAGAVATCALAMRAPRSRRQASAGRIAASRACHYGVSRYGVENDQAHLCTRMRKPPSGFPEGGLAHRLLASHRSAPGRGHELSQAARHMLTETFGCPDIHSHPSVGVVA